MRVPKTPPPFSERQITPEIQRGEFETRAPEESFGGVSQQNIRSIGEDATLATKIQDTADQFEINQAKNAYLQQKSQFLAPVLQTQGMNAAQYKPDLKDGPTGKFLSTAAQSTLSMAKNGKQQRLLQEFISDQDSQVKNVLETHIAKQLTMASGKNNLDLVKENLNQAPMVYDNEAARSLGRKGVVDAVNQLMDWKGVPADSAERKLQTETQLNNWDAMITQSYLAHNNPNGAKAYLDGLEKSGELTGPKLSNLMKPVGAAMTRQNALTYYNDNNFKFRDEQGYTNAGSLINSFRASSDYAKMSPEQQQRSESVILAQVGHDKKVVDQQKSSRWNRFQDVLDNALKDPNVPLSKLQAIPAQVGGYGSEQLRMEDFINRRYQERTGLSIFVGGKGSDLAQTHNNLYEAIQNGTLIDREVIGKMFDQHLLNPKEYGSALKMFDAVQKGGVNKEVTMTRNFIRRQAEDVLPDRDAVNNYMIQFAEKTQGQTPEQMNEYAKKTLDPQLKNPSSFWDRIMGNKNADVDMSEQDMMKSLNFEIGKEPVNGILSSLATPENPKPSLKDVQGFLHALGDVSLDQIKRGTPINNAMQSLVNWNHLNPDKAKPFDPKLILWLSENHPNGLF